MTKSSVTLAAVVAATFFMPAHAEAVYEILGPMISHHSQQSVIEPYNETHAGIGLRISRTLESFTERKGVPKMLADSKVQTQFGVYVFNDSFRTTSLQSQYGVRMKLGDTPSVSWEAAANANLLYKGINWRGDRSWYVAPSLDLIATYDKRWGATLSYYPYRSERNEKFQQIVTFKIHYRLGDRP